MSRMKGESKMERPAKWMVLALAFCFVGGLYQTPASAEPLGLEQSQAAEQQQPKVPKEVSQALDLFRQKDAAGAYELLKKAYELHPELSPPEILMAQFFGRIGQMDVAFGWIERAGENFPDDPEAYFMLSQFAIQQGRLVGAGLLLEKGNALVEKYDKDPQRKEKLQLLHDRLMADMALRQNNWSLARLYLESVLAVKPEDVRALQLYSQTLFEDGKVEEALEKLRELKKTNETALTPEAILATWFQQKGDKDNAKKYMIEAINQAPNDFNTRLAAAHWAFQINEFDQAKKQIDIASKLDPNSLDAKLLAGTIALFQADYPTAEKYFKAVYIERPSSFASSNNLALALAEQADRQKQQQAFQYAQQNAQRVQQLTPQNQKEAYSTLGRVLFLQGRLQDAQQILEKAVSLGGQVSPDTAYYLAEVCAENGQKEQAISYLDSAIKSQAPFSKREAAEKLLKRLNQ